MDLLAQVVEELRDVQGLWSIAKISYKRKRCHHQVALPQPRPVSKSWTHSGAVFKRWGHERKGFFNGPGIIVEMEPLKETSLKEVRTYWFLPSCYPPVSSSISLKQDRLANVLPRTAPQRGRGREQSWEPRDKQMT